MDETGQLLGSFLPTQLLGRLYGALGELPTEVEFRAAVLLVDISRFTALVEQLARRGHAGLEEVPRLLSSSYARCAEHVGARGGEVAYFAGDSLLAYWAADAKSLGDAIRTAVECVKAICQDHLERAGVTLDDDEPALHFGVGAGRLWAGALGGEPIWNLVIGGEAVIESAKALMRARSWEYVVSENAMRALGDNPVLNVDKNDPVSAPLPRPPFLWLAKFLTPQLQEVFQTAGLGWESGKGKPPTDRDGPIDISARLDALADIRPISALFARIAGLGSAGLDSLAHHHALCKLLQQIVREHGGPVGELLFDDKGLIFFATFGTRGTFHRDDPQRAVDAARTIHQAVQRLGLAISVGVATGDAFFRVVGSARRRQLMVLGSPMNRAARLMTAIEQDILCDVPTERAAREAFSFERHGTLQLEGIGDMAPAFRPLEAKRPALLSSKLIGRHHELEVLRQTFDETRGGANRLVVVVGAPGIGKTTLVNAFTEGLLAAGTKVSVSRAERDDRRTSLLAWRRVLESLVDLPTDGDGTEIFDRINLRARNLSSISGRLPLLGDVLAIETHQSEETRHLEGAHRADATMRLLGEVISGLAPRPLALVLEDSQWLDSASWRLIEWVMSSLSSLMIVLCVRAEEVPEQLRSLRQRAKATWLETEREDAARYLKVLELTELGDTSIHEIVTRTLGDVPPHEEITRRVAALAGGNPFFAEEISLSLKSEGLIAKRDGLWRSIRPLDGLQYFEGVERIIRERVDHLNPATQDVIKAAAVIGRSFTSDALMALQGQPVDEAVETLIGAHLVRPAVEPGQYEFRHDQIRDVVYASIPGDLKIRLHGTLANWIETTRPDAIGAETAMLVQHFEAAGNTDKAVKYADLAATDALQKGAFREVEAFLDICIEHEPRSNVWTNEQKLRSVRWRRQLAEAHYSRGDIHAQGVAVRHALSVAGQPVPGTFATTIIKLIKRGLHLAIRQALPLSPKLNADDNELRWQGELARCLNQAATVDYFELRVSRGMCNLLGAVIHAERTGFSVDMAVASAQLGCGLAIIGWPGLSTHFIERAERVAVALADPAVHSHVCSLDALSQIGRCEWATVDRRLDQAQDLALKAGDHLRWCNAQGMRFWSQYYRGDQGAWEPTSLALLSRAQNAGNIQQEIWALRCKALCLLHTDRPREAVDLLGLITSAMPGSVDLAARISAMGALALALARVGQSTKGVEAAVETLRLLHEMGRPSSHSIIVGISGAMEVLLRGREAGLAQKYEQWSDWEAQALHHLKRYSKVFPVGLAQLGLWTGVADWLDDRKDRALSNWKAALIVARKFSLRKDESLIAAEIRRRQDRF